MKTFAIQSCLAAVLASSTLLVGCQNLGMVSSNLENSVSEQDKQECSSKAMGGELFATTFDGKVYAACLKEKSAKK